MQALGSRTASSRVPAARPALGGRAAAPRPAVARCVRAGAGGGGGAPVAGRRRPRGGREGANRARAFRRGPDRSEDAFGAGAWSRVSRVLADGSPRNSRRGAPSAPRPGSCHSRGARARGAGEARPGDAGCGMRGGGRSGGRARLADRCRRAVAAFARSSAVWRGASMPGRLSAREGRRERAGRAWARRGAGRRTRSARLWPRGRRRGGARVRAFSARMRGVIAFVLRFAGAAIAPQSLRGAICALPGGALAKVREEARKGGGRPIVHIAGRRSGSCWPAGAFPAERERGAGRAGAFFAKKEKKGGGRGSVSRRWV